MKYLFWTLEREFARTLGEETPLWGRGALGPQWGTMSVSWVWTGGERRRSKMSENKEDDPITASRNVHAQSKCHCALISNSVSYPLQELYFIVLLFQENKSFGAGTICIHPLMYRKPCQEQCQCFVMSHWCIPSGVMAWLPRHGQNVTMFNYSGWFCHVFFLMKGVNIIWPLSRATNRYFYALKIYGAILPQNKQILCRYFTIKQRTFDDFFKRNPKQIDKDLLAKK